MILHKIHLLIIFLPTFGLASQITAQEPPVDVGQQLLLMRNGQAIEGRVSRAGDVYRVALPDGEIRIRATEVELVCKSLEEGYQRKRAAIPAGSLRDHLELSQWCLRHRLYDHAKIELEDAAAIAPTNPMVGYMQRRLNTTLEPSSDPTPPPVVSKEQSVSNEELDRMVRGLPHKAVENFTQSVQPLLVNNCTMAGCHGPQSTSGLRLQRISQNQPVGRRLTQRNIYAVLQYIDRTDPLSSQILTVPTAAHGTAKTPVFSEHQAMQYKKLVDWVLQLGPSVTPENPATVPDLGPIKTESFAEVEPAAIVPHVLSAEAKKARPLSSASKSDAPAGLTSDALLEKQPEPTKQGTIQTTFQTPAAQAIAARSANKDIQTPKIKRGPEPTKYVPKDPFDPEIFNRQYAKPPQSSGESK